MNEALLSEEIQQFMDDHLYDDPTKLVLKYKEINGVAFSEIIEQIEAKVRCKKKLPTWFSTEKIYYPNKLNIEQTSSEKTANYKASLVNGNHCIDITGGFGVDAYAFTKRFKQVTHCELSAKLSAIVTHNFQVFGVTSVETKQVDGIVFLETTNQKYDCVYVDPSRRNDAKGKVFLLEDCLPDVVSHQKVLLDKASKVMIKTSPLLDITNGLRVLEHVTEIHVVAVQNEVKELLWLLEDTADSEQITIRTVNLMSQNEEKFSFTLSEETSAEASYNLPQKYVYEPNAAIMKAGAFRIVAQKFKLKKLHPHSHLYTSDTLIDFPGRRFEILQILPYHKKTIKKTFHFNKANITTRNFPESVATIRKKLSIADGGDHYLFFTTLHDQKKAVLHCKKV